MTASPTPPGGCKWIGEAEVETVRITPDWFRYHCRSGDLSAAQIVAVKSGAVSRARRISGLVEEIASGARWRVTRWEVMR